MNTQDFIALNTLSTHYNLESSFFNHLEEIGLIEIKTIEETHYIHQDYIYEIEKIIRINNELDINMEGIDVVFNLLKKIDQLQNDLIALKNRLRLYENI